MKHEIINQGKYLLSITERGVYEGWAYHPTSNTVYRFGDLITSFERKVIAHLPLNGSPILEGVDLLPPLEEDDAVKWARSQYSSEHGDYEEIYYLGLIKGYNQAKEKYKYTEEDLRKAFRLFFRNNMLEIDDIIQSLSQPKMPIGFERYYNGEDIAAPKITTTPEGHTQWVGKYIYQ